MIAKLAKRLLVETDGRLLAKFVYNFGFKGMRAVQAFKRRVKRGESFPAFLVLSITNNCNLACQGCWNTPTNPSRQLSVETMDRIIRECNRHGSWFFGILGGEPLLHSGLFELIARHPSSYFQIFTNGAMLTAETAAEMRRLGNVTPLVSIEGRERVSDERRGGTEVYRRSVEALGHCREHRLITGVATSVCRSNIDELVCDDFVRDLIHRGVHYLWYYLYRPVGPNPSPALALDAEEILRVRRFIVDARSTAPIILVDAYWDHDGAALCPAAVGISHHIGPDGHLEPCPPIQFARDRIDGAADPGVVVANSEFLKTFREWAASVTRGCVLLERPDLLKEFLEKEDARDSSGRGTALEELAAMTPRPGHHLPGREIPEKHWLYRFAKKHWFFGFGAYG